MKAVLLDGFGGLEVLKIGEVDKLAKAGEVLIRSQRRRSTADLVQRGKYPPPPGDSEILGLEVAGTIAELGAGVSGWRSATGSSPWLAVAPTPNMPSPTPVT
jgi:NADPH:quinone reductase-like Zn-dependent oxidoreductase